MKYNKFNALSGGDAFFAYPQTKRDLHVKEVSHETCASSAGGKSPPSAQRVKDISR